MRYVKVLISIALISLLGFGVYQELFKSDFTKIKTVVISGAEPLTVERIKKLHHIPERISFWKVGVEEVADRVRTDDWVEDVTVKKIFPDKVEIQVTERTPQAVVSKDGRQFDYVDKANFIFGPVPLKKLENHVVFSGKNIATDKKLRQDTLDLLNQFPEDGVLSRKDISELQFHSEKGFQAVLAETGIVVDLGKENIPLHIDRARKVVQYLEQHQINASHVDADYAKKVLVKVRKDR